MVVAGWLTGEEAADSGSVVAAPELRREVEKGDVRDETDGILAVSGNGGAGRPSGGPEQFVPRGMYFGHFPFGKEVAHGHLAVQVRDFGGGCVGDH